MGKIAPQFFTASDGAQIAFYEQSGAPKTLPLVVVAGGPGADYRYLTVGGSFAAVEKHRRVVFFDQRGSSQSSDAGETTTIDRFVDDIDNLRQALGVHQIDLFGHSFGGYLAMAYAAKHCHHLSRLVVASSQSPKLSDTPQLLDQVFPERAPLWREVRARLPSKFRASEMALFYSMEFMRQEDHDLYELEVADHIYNVAVNNALREDMASLDFTDALKYIKVPTLVMHGRHDAIIAPAAGWRIHQAIPNSQMHFFEDSAHMPHVESPAEFAKTMLRFLNTA